MFSVVERYVEENPVTMGHLTQQLEAARTEYKLIAEKVVPAPGDHVFVNLIGLIDERDKKIERLQTIIDFYNADPRTQFVVKLYSELSAGERKKIDNLMEALLDIKRSMKNFEKEL